MKRPVKRLEQALDWLCWSSAAELDKQQRLAEYSAYRMAPREFMLSAAIGAAAAFTLFYTFYQSLGVAVGFASLGIVAPRLRNAGLLDKRRVRLQLQFKEALYSVTSSLAAGRSVENAFVAAEADLQLLYPGHSADIVREFAMIRYRMENGDTLESGLRQLADRAKLEDITQFVDVFSTCKRSGGDLVDVIRRTSQVIGEKLDIQQEIAVMLAQKRFESRILIAVPFVFIAGLNLAAPDYTEPLYNSPLGYVLLTILLLGFAGCGALIRKIMAIRL
ncbi:type II secretion system F family protein [Paenibacillus sp. MMS18-CY102]|uniref:type II secretion system F family protein n=1 Tax=Paenibacillus sp. MMS18-CY102 TaxID=2682849 RepID=UPI001365F37C|nr:type II secretion system F family protein [Paenibacillus sp. MMS18-CY102]MWC30107.1 pilus assembly protein TadB [Paenibacillus sp. MMS18-CY102]